MESAFSKSQDTVLLIIYWIFVFKMVAEGCAEFEGTGSAGRQKMDRL
jgi:hypothetical protein